MQPNILDSITNQYNSMTRSGKKLADYIFSNKSQTQYMSITSLAEASGVSEASITRFCRGLGLAGYNDFKLALAKNDHPAFSDGSLGDRDDVTEKDSIKMISKKLCQIDITALSETLELIDSESAALAVNLLTEADRVFCFGQGGSNVMAREAWALFSTASPCFIHIEDSHMQAMAASLCTTRDIILFFSYSGSTRDMLDVLRPAKTRGAKIILITHFSNSPAAVISDVILLCGSNESPLQSGSIAAKMAQMFVIDYLFHAYCLQNRDICTEARATTAQATARKLL